MYKWMIIVLPFSREPARGKLGSQDRFLKAQVAEYLNKKNEQECFIWIYQILESKHCLDSGERRKILIRWGFRKLSVLFCLRDNDTECETKVSLEETGKWKNSKLPGTINLLLPSDRKQIEFLINDRNRKKM